MANKFRYILLALVLIAGPIALHSQDTLDAATTSVIIRDNVLDTGKNKIVIIDRDQHKPIPDKVFEFGIPFLLILLVLNTITTIFKIKAEVQLKEKALEKGISEATLVELFKEDKQMARNAYLKWFLVLAAIGIALIYIHLLHQ
ncbi:MAG TPA: hypothetical protein VD996_03545, partial [Chitinophagaceae bacterium]|nr:hypothetical protein [Chitinophagaceae bacterium]